MRYLFLCLLIPFLYAEEKQQLNDEPKYDLNITNHEMTLNGKKLEYTAITGTCPVVYDNTVEAELFFIAYLQDLETDRPLTFVFPGGPGGAGTLESILTFGPRRLLTSGEGRSVLPPYQIIDNPETLLNQTDLVFIDPPNCGYSQVTEEGDQQWFYSVEGDISALAQFIHHVIDFGKRWNSPIYLAGGSYGTLRACGIAYNLLSYGIATKGIILDGCAFEFPTHISSRDLPLPDCLMIPTFAATAWYHKRLWPEKSLEEVVDYARRFAYDEYAPFMLQPSRLSYVEKLEFQKRFATLIGLPEDTVKKYSFRINEKIYAQEFFSPERKILGRLDSRYSGDVFTIDPDHSHDPSYMDCFGIGPAFQHYLQSELDTEFPFKRYQSFSREALQSWNFGTYDNFGLPSLLQRIRRTLIYNPHMKIFVGSGYYDCRTPFAATEYCFDHLDLPESYRKNLTFEYYEAGHGFIFDYASLKKVKKDLSTFYNDTPLNQLEHKRINKKQ